MTFELLDPTQGARRPEYSTAPRLADLSGARVALLDNSKTNAAKFLGIVGEILEEEFKVGEVRMFRKDALSRPAPDAVLTDVAEFADFAVTGIGDCGSCSTNSVHDAIELEKKAVPTVAVCTEAFLPGLDALCAMRGMPDYRFAVVPHPLGVLFDDELRGRAKLAAPQIAAITLGRSSRPDS